MCIRDSRQLSGTGGQLDFLEGAFRSEGGKGFICLASSRRKKDGTLKSNIVPFISAQSVVSAPRSMIQYVATEYGLSLIHIFFGKLFLKCQLGYYTGCKLGNASKSDTKL